MRSCRNPVPSFCLFLSACLLLLLLLLFLLFALNETAPVVCYETKKANNPSLNNRATLEKKKKEKKNIAPGCPSASGPGIRLQLAQLHSLASAIFSRKENVIPRYSWNYDFIDIITCIFFLLSSPLSFFSLSRQTTKSRAFPLNGVKLWERRGGWGWWWWGGCEWGNLTGKCQSLSRCRFFFLDLADFNHCHFVWCNSSRGGPAASRNTFPSAAWFESLKAQEAAAVLHSGNTSD